jgi:hypothetical protein
MEKSVEFYQVVEVVGYGTRWSIPRIRNGDRWRNIQNTDLVMNIFHLNGCDKYEESVVRIKNIMEKRGWKTEISDTKQHCHEHLYYQHYRLKCWK